MNKLLCNLEDNCLEECIPEQRKRNRNVDITCRGNNLQNETLPQPMEPGYYPNIISPASSDHSYCAISESLKCEACMDKDNLIKSYVNRVEILEKKIRNMKQHKQVLKIKNDQVTFSWKKFKSDKEMKFYTGISFCFTFQHLVFSIAAILTSIIFEGPKRE